MGIHGVLDFPFLPSLFPWICTRFTWGLKYLYLAKVFAFDSGYVYIFDLNPVKLYRNWTGLEASLVVL